jgi:hypothetical protein
MISRDTAIRLRLAAVLNDLDQIVSDMSWQHLPQDQIEPVRKALSALEKAVKVAAHNDGKTPTSTEEADRG